MPALSDNNTIGGNDYAVIGSIAASNDNDIYKSFDLTSGGTGTYGILNYVNSGYIIYYSPVPLKLTQIIFTTPGAR